MAVKKKNKDPLKSKADWSIQEFQMWLHGAYSLQGEDWVPNAEQWEMIVDIIYKLKDRGVVQKKISPPVGPITAPLGYGGPVVDGGYPAPLNPSMGPSPMAGSVMDVPPEAQLSLSELRRRSEGVGVSSGLPAGEKEIKTNQFE